MEVEDIEAEDLVFRMTSKRTSFFTERRLPSG